MDWPVASIGINMVKDSHPIGLRIGKLTTSGSGTTITQTLTAAYTRSMDRTPRSGTKSRMLTHHCEVLVKRFWKELVEAHSEECSSHEYLREEALPLTLTVAGTQLTITTNTPCNCKATKNKPFASEDTK